MDGDSPLSADAPRRPFAWTAVLRALGLALDARKILLALLGLLLARIGSAAIGAVLGRNAGAGGRRVVAAFDIGTPIEDPAAWLALASAPILEPALAVFGPIFSLFWLPESGQLASAVMLEGAWTLVTWAIVGGAILRIGVVQAAGAEGVGLLGALRFSARRWFPLIAAPLGPLAVSAMLALPVVLIGLAPAAVAPVLEPASLLLSLLVSLLLVGVALAWPLMVGTVAAEGEDVFDAVSRSFAYVNQRLIRYAGYLGVAILAGILGRRLIVGFLQLAIGLDARLRSVGGGPPAPIIPAAAFDLGLYLPGDPGSAWATLLGLLVRAWTYSYFWSAIAVIYLLLRRDVDGTPWHDVYEERHETDEFAPAMPAAPAETRPES